MIDKTLKSNKTGRQTNADKRAEEKRIAGSIKGIKDPAIQKYIEKEVKERLWEQLKQRAAEEKRSGRPSLQTLEDKIVALLIDEGIPAKERPRLQRQFMAEVMQAKQDTPKTDLRLPKKAPELWRSGQGETALEFMQRVYKPYLEAEILPWKWLNEHDPKLVKAVSALLSKNKNADRSLLPLTESDLLDREYEGYIQRYGRDTIDRIISISRSLQKRSVRERKKTSDEPEPD